MARKGENIYHRRDGRWEGRYLERQGDVCRRRSVYGRSYQEAKAKLLQAQRMVWHGRQTAPTEVFAESADQWLAQKRRFVKDSTYHRYRTLVENHLKPALGTRPLATIGQNELNALVRGLSERLADGTVRNVLSVLKMIFRGAAARGLPVPLVPAMAPHSVKKEVRVLSAAEYERLARHLLAGHGAPGLGILLALECGLRIGEVCALRWGDVSVEEGMLTVCETLQRLPLPGGGTRLAFTGPKSAASRREIPLRRELAALCAPLKKEAEAFFLTGTIKPMEPQNLRYHLQSACAACGLEGVHFHTLRHTFATRCVEAGCEVKVLSEILGHASTRITLDRYVHPSFSAKRANLERLRIAVYAPQQGTLPAAQ